MKLILVAIVALSLYDTKVGFTHNPKISARIQESGVRSQNTFGVSIQQLADFLNKAEGFLRIGIFQISCKDQVIATLFSGCLRDVKESDLIR